MIAPANPLGQDTQLLFKKARESRERSYSPYSRCKVGAAVRLEDGRMFGGCNVENSSYGGSICAERTAILKAVSESDRPVRIAELVVVTDASPPWPPCGFCRQALAEFAGPRALVHAANLHGEVVSAELGLLFPDAFTPERLKNEGARGTTVHRQSGQEGES